MKIMNFEFKISRIGSALVLTLILMILKSCGVIECARWVTLLPIIILFGWYVIAIWLVGFIILLYFVFEHDNGDSESES